MRASDRDREVVIGVLAEAYADGRLSREEYDERVDITSGTRTLGELPPIVADLVPLPGATSTSALARTTDIDLHARAIRKYESERREALSGFLIVSVIVTTIWFVTDTGGFFWPIFVILAAGANLARVVIHKQDIVDREHRRLEKKADKERARIESPRTNDSETPES